MTGIGGRFPLVTAAHIPGQVLAQGRQRRILTGDVTTCDAPMLSLPQGISEALPSPISCDASRRMAQPVTKSHWLNPLPDGRPRRSSTVSPCSRLVLLHKGPINADTKTRRIVQVQHTIAYHRAVRVQAMMDRIALVISVRFRRKGAGAKG